MLLTCSFFFCLFNIVWKLFTRLSEQKFLQACICKQGHKIKYVDDCCMDVMLQFTAIYHGNTLNFSENVAILEVIGIGSVVYCGPFSYGNAKTFTNSSPAFPF